VSLRCRQAGRAGSGQRMSARHSLSLARAQAEEAGGTHPATAAAIRSRADLSRAAWRTLRISSLDDPGCDLLLTGRWSLPRGVGSLLSVGAIFGRPNSGRNLRSATPHSGYGHCSFLLDHIPCQRALYCPSSADDLQPSTMIVELGRSSPSRCNRRPMTSLCRDSRSGNPPAVTTDHNVLFTPNCPA
jgi:hypothetical protein